MFRKLGEVYRNCFERYSSGLRRRTLLYVLVSGLAILPFLPLGCEQEPEEAETKKKTKKTVEIATVNAGEREQQGDKKVQTVPGRLVIWRYDGKGGYAPIFEHKGLEFWPEVAAGDVDNDGIDDVVYAHRKGLFVLSYKGGRFVSKEIDGSQIGALRLAVGDMDKRGGEDVFLIDRTLLYYYAFDDSGKATKSFLGKNWLYNKVAVGDPDGDGNNEVITLPVRDYTPMIIGEVVDGELQIEYMVGYDPERRMREEGLSEDSVLKVEVEGFDGDVPPLLWYGNKQKACVGGDDGRDILISGGAEPKNESGRFQVLRYTGKGFESLYVSEKLPCIGGAWACAFGDATNDGREDVVIGSDRVMVYTYKDKSFRKVWEGEPVGSRAFVGVSSVCVADTDGDGLNEILASAKMVPTSEHGYITERLVIYGNRERGETKFFKEWESEDFPGWMCIATGDFDGK